jgi:hypothetical protein
MTSAEAKRSLHTASRNVRFLPIADTCSSYRRRSNPDGLPIKNVGIVQQRTVIVRLESATVDGKQVARSKVRFSNSRFERLAMDPAFKEWEQANEKLKQVKKAHRHGNASQSDVKKAQEEYDRIAEKIGKAQGL